jgi:hypothetical protein
LMATFSIGWILDDITVFKSKKGALNGAAGVCYTQPDSLSPYARAVGLVACVF